MDASGRDGHKEGSSAFHKMKQAAVRGLNGSDGGLR